MSILVSTIAGCGQKGLKDGKAENAMFDKPRNLCISDDGKIYISDGSNDRIRLLYDGTVSTIAGGKPDPESEDGIFDIPDAVCISDDGTLYVSDTFHNCIKMISDGVVSTIAGCGERGHRDGKVEEAIFYNPCGICLSNDGKIYVADNGNHRIRMISDGMVTTIAGCGQFGFKDGKAEEAMLRNPYGICVSEDNKVYITDYYNHCVRMISDGIISTIAGSGKQGFQDGKAEEAMFDGPCTICIDDDNKLHVVDRYNHCIRMISDGIVSTIVGKGKEIYQDGERLNMPNGICMSNEGNLYITEIETNYIRMILGLPISPTRYFELSSLLHSKSLSDMTLTINNHQYHLHTAVVNSLCPMIIKYKSIIEDAKISNESLQTMFEMIYSNNTNIIRKHRDQYQMADLTHLTELIWLFDSFEIKNESFLATCIKQFKTEMKYFMKQDEHKSTAKRLKKN